MNDNQSEIKFQIMLIGNSCVGKTCFSKRYIENSYLCALSLSSVGCEVKNKTITVNEEKASVTVALFDTSGQEKYNSITKNFCRKADGFLVFYDITDLKSFEALEVWIKNINEVSLPGIRVCIVGTKSDMEKERQVDMKKAQTFALKKNYLFWETSSLNGNNVEKCVQELAEMLYKDYVRNMKEGNGNQLKSKSLEEREKERREKKKQEGGCCS